MMSSETSYREPIGFAPNRPPITWKSVFQSAPIEGEQSKSNLTESFVQGKCSATEFHVIYIGRGRADRVSPLEGEIFQPLEAVVRRYRTVWSPTSVGRGGATFPNRCMADVHGRKCLGGASCRQATCHKRLPRIAAA